MKKNTLTILLILFFYLRLTGQNNNESSKIIFNTGFEYIEPSHNNRQIKTTSVHFLYGWQYFQKTPLTIYVGTTLTYAYGSIIQLDENFNDVISKNNAFGIGPVFNIQFEPFIFEGFSISPYFSGGFILYSEKFPHGGDIYNFIWKAGGSLHYRLNNKFKINLSLIWMHVSNGQGLTPKNPSYEGFGINLSLTKFLKQE